MLMHFAFLPRFSSAISFFPPETVDPRASNSCQRAGQAGKASANHAPLASLAGLTAPCPDARDSVICDKFRLYPVHHDRIKDMRIPHMNSSVYFRVKSVPFHCEFVSYLILQGVISEAR